MGQWVGSGEITNILTLTVPCVSIVLLASLPITAAIFQSHCFCVSPFRGIK